MKKNIVIVDDFENTRYVVKLSLKHIDAELLEAEDGMEALKYFDGRQIDLLITDYNMPKLDGVELVKKVREMDSYSFIPILMLTTERDSKKKEKALDVKVTSWIQKPFSQGDFIAIVKKCLRIS